MDRDQVRQSVRCPRCGARPGEKCIQGGRYKPTNCPARIGLAEMTIGWRDPPPSPFARKARRENRRIRSGG